MYQEILREIKLFLFADTAKVLNILKKPVMFTGESLQPQNTPLPHHITLITPHIKTPMLNNTPLGLYPLMLTTDNLSSNLPHTMMWLIEDKYMNPIFYYFFREISRKKNEPRWKKAQF